MPRGTGKNEAFEEKKANSTRLEEQFFLSVAKVLVGIFFFECGEFIIWKFREGKQVLKVFLYLSKPIKTAMRIQYTQF